MMKCAICMFEHPNRFPIFLAKWYKSFDVTPFKRRNTAVFISVLLFKAIIFSFMTLISLLVSISLKVASK